MIEFLLRHQATIRECINGSAFVLFHTLTVMITVFIWDTWIRVGPISLRLWRKIDGVKTACVLWWIFSAEAYRTFNVWNSYVQGRIPRSTDLITAVSSGVGVFAASSINSTVGYLMAGVVLNVALLIAIEQWTPPDWRSTRIWAWALCWAIVIMFLPTIVGWK